MNTYLPYILIAVNVILIVLILIQQKGTALGASFGQGEGGFYGTMRGVEKKIFWATCIFGAAFITLVLLSHVFNA